MNAIHGGALAQCGYLSQIATMADASEVITDGPLLRCTADEVIWVPLDSEYRRYAEVNHW